MLSFILSCNTKYLIYSWLQYEIFHSFLVTIRNIKGNFIQISTTKNSCVFDIAALGTTFNVLNYDAV